MRYVKGNAHAGKRTLEGQRNPGKRWNERNNPTEKIKPAKHLLNNINHSFKWETYCLLRKNKRKKKILGFFIAAFNLALNKRVNSDVLRLFRNENT